MKRPIYADYAATTPVDERVAERLTQCLTFTGNFGNPASRSHGLGWDAEEAVEIARGQVASALNADPREIIFTSGATESDNLALKGVMEREPSGHLITSAIEHKAVLDTARWLETQGYSVTYLKPDAKGQFNLDQLDEALRPDTRLVSLMHVNNELGTALNLTEVGHWCRAHEVLFHTDAAQGFGKLPIDVRADGIDLLSISGHKIYGPKGIGVLYVRHEPPLHLVAQIHGGGHERGLRSGTLPTHQIVGIGAASAIMQAEGGAEATRLEALRERLLTGLLALPGTVLHGHRTHRVAGIVNIGFEGVEGETLLLALDDVAVSNGSACTSASVEPSFVLQGLGVPEALAHASLRLSLGRYSTAEDVDHIVDRLTEITDRLRKVA